MASDKASMPSIPTEDSKSTLPPSVLTLGSTANTQIIHLPATAPRNFFTGRNLYHWRRFVERVLPPRKLDGHLINSRPKDTDAHYLRWLDEEDVIFTWMLDSMKPEVSERFIDLDSIKDVWDTVIRLYSKLEDESRIAELNRKAMDLLQEQQTVLEFANALNALWSELDFYQPLPTDSTDREYILKGRTHCFLISTYDGNNQDSHMALYCTVQIATCNLHRSARGKRAHHLSLTLPCTRRGVLVTLSHNRK